MDTKIFSMMSIIVIGALTTLSLFTVATICPMNHMQYISSRDLGLILNNTSQNIQQQNLQAALQNQTMPTAGQNNISFTINLSANQPLFLPQLFHQTSTIGQNIAVATTTPPPNHVNNGQLSHTQTTQTNNAFVQYCILPRPINTFEYITNFVSNISKKKTEDIIKFFDKKATDDCVKIEDVTRAYMNLKDSYDDASKTKNVVDAALYLEKARAFTAALITYGHVKVAKEIYNKLTNFSDFVIQLDVPSMIEPVLRLLRMHQEISFTEFTTIKKELAQHNIDINKVLQLYKLEVKLTKKRARSEHNDQCTAHKNKKQKINSLDGAENTSQIISEPSIEEYVLQTYLNEDAPARTSTNKHAAQLIQLLELASVDGILKDVHIQNTKHHSILDLACKCDDKKLIEYLIQRAPNDVSCLSTLNRSIISGSIDSVKTVWETTKKNNHPFINDLIPYLCSNALMNTTHGNSIVQWLLSTEFGLPTHLVAPMVNGDFTKTPLMSVAAHWTPELAQLLITNGATITNCNEQDGDKTAFDYAATNKKHGAAIMKILYEKNPECLIQKAKDGISPLLRAVKSNNIALIEYIVKNVNQATKASYEYAAFLTALENKKNKTQEKIANAEKKLLKKRSKQQRLLALLSAPHPSQQNQ